MIPTRPARRNSCSTLSGACAKVRARAMSFGNTMHTTIKHFIAELRAGRWLPFEEVAAIFEREWIAAGLRRRLPAGRIQERWARSSFARFTLFMMPKGAERTRTGKAIRVAHGRRNFAHRTHGPDQPHRRGQITKSWITRPASPSPNEHAQKDLQLSIYALAAREVLDLNPMRLVFHNLQDNSRVETTRDEKHFKKVREKITETAADIRALNFEPRPNSGFVLQELRFPAFCAPRTSRISSSSPNSSRLA